MAFHVKCANALIRIHQRDHDPPHCHVLVDNQPESKVLLRTLRVFEGPPLLKKVKKCLKKHQKEMLESWNRDVVVISIGDPS
jgi:hypothetical protein